MCMCVCVLAIYCMASTFSLGVEAIARLSQPYTELFIQIPYGHR